MLNLIQRRQMSNSGKKYKKKLAVLAARQKDYDTNLAKRGGYTKPGAQQGNW